MKISVKRDIYGRSAFDNEEYLIDLSRKFEGYEYGDIIIHGTPFDSTGQFPLELEIAIRRNGDFVFRNWRFVSGSNQYFHLLSICNDVSATQEQKNTVSGLFSGRIKFEGLKISIGSSIQKICPIDIKTEEKLTGKKIYLN